MPYIETADGTSLFYRDWGAGRPVVFVHGWALGGDIWEYQMTDPAAAGLRCVAYDKRGCGRSDQPGAGYDIDTLAGDMADVMRGLDLRDVTLVAHSMGCAEAARCMAGHADGRIARAVFIAPTTPFPGETEAARASYEEMLAGLAADRPAYLKAAGPSFFGTAETVSEEILAWGVGLIQRASPKATAEMIRTMAGTDSRSDLAAIDVPTLVIHGDADQGAPLEMTGRPTAAAIAGSRLDVYEGAPHGLFITHRQRLNEDLFGFAGAEAVALAEAAA